MPPKPCKSPSLCSVSVTLKLHPVLRFFLFFLCPRCVIVLSCCNSTSDFTSWPQNTGFTVTHAFITSLLIHTEGSLIYGPTCSSQKPWCTVVCSANVRDMNIMYFTALLFEIKQPNTMTSDRSINQSDACSYLPSIILGMFIPAVSQIHLQITWKHWMDVIKSKSHRCSFTQKPVDGTFLFFFQLLPSIPAEPL